MNDAPVRLADHAAYEAHWRNQKAWLEAIDKAAQSGDLTDIVRLICSGAPVDYSIRLRLEKLGADYRLTRTKRGRKTLREKLQMTKEEQYALACKDVELLKEAQEQWKGEVKRWKEARKKARRRGETEEIIFVVRSEGGLFAVFNEPMREFAESLMAIDDPVAHVAEERGLDAEKLGNDIAGWTGWRRRGKPKTPAQK
jgi:hypothetical protein